MSGIKKYITNVTGLQLFQLMRFGTMFLIGIVFAKSYLSTQDIGRYETFLFLAGASTFFWLNGIITSLLPVHKNNITYKSFEKSGKSPEFFNAFILLLFLSSLASFLVYNLAGYIEASLLHRAIPFKNLLVLYIVLAPPVYLNEFIFLLRKQPKRMVLYGMISFGLQFVFVVAPVLARLELQYAIFGLIAIAGLRWILLIFLLIRFSRISLSTSYMKEHLKVGVPLIISSLLSGSAQYIDGFIISNRFDEATFAIFRYGAREFPFVVILANAFSNAMTTEFKNTSLDIVLDRIKKGSIRLMHVVFPATMVLLLISNWFYPIIFNPTFLPSAKVFNIYLVLVMSRMVFPQTILIGLKRTNYIMFSSFFELTINVFLSLLFVDIWGMVGVAYATVVAYIADKIILIIVNAFVFKIPPARFIAFQIHLLYSLATLIIFVFIDFYLYV